MEWRAFALRAALISALGAQGAGIGGCRPSPAAPESYMDRCETTDDACVPPMQCLEYGADLALEVDAACTIACDVDTDCPVQELKMCPTIVQCVEGLCYQPHDCE